MTVATRVVWLTIGGRDVASSRVRAFRLAESLDRFGVPAECLVGTGVRGRLRALARIFAPGRPVIVVQKILYGRLMLRMLRWRARRLVWECDDALHIGFPGTSRAELQRTRRLLRLVLRLADVVTTSNSLLAEELRPSSGNVLTLRGPAPEISAAPSNRDRVVLWLGSPSTERYLALLGDTPTRLAVDGWSFVAVGASEAAEACGWHAVPWSFAEQERWLVRASVGVMPQLRDPWSDRKQGYKLLEYMSHGVVPVTSDIPVARSLLEDKELEPLLVTGDEWADAIEFAARERETLLPRLGQIVESLSAEAAATAWLEAVGVVR